MATPVPTDAVSAVAGAVIKAEEIAEKVIDLANTPQMQAAKAAAQEGEREAAVEVVVEKRDVKATQDLLGQ